MDYVIKNNKDIYVRLNENGSPITCSEHNKGLFEYNKAKNICCSLPRILKKMNFFVEAVPDILQKEEKGRVITIDTYEPNENITRWINKFGACGDILDEARKRQEELKRQLSNVDKEFQNLIHKIEYEDKVDLYNAWLERNEIKRIREKRRQIKDEILIIQTVLSNGINYLKRDNIQKAVDGLSNRKYKFRIIEEDESDAVV